MKNKQSTVVLILLLVAFVLLSAIPFVLSFRGRDSSSSVSQTAEPTPVISEPKNETPLELITAQELLQYISENDVGVTEDDFEGIDIDEFIECWKINRQPDGRILGIRYRLDNYENKKESDKINELKARELISVDSTKEEYEAFIEAYFEAIDMEYEARGISESGLDNYGVYPTGDSRDTFKRFHLYIGKTMEFHQHDIRGTNLFLPGGDWGSYWELNICYNKDNKFFLAILGPNAADIPDGLGVYYKLYKTFSEL